jgi:NADH-quinone oxidoreductase subunit E
MGCDEIKDYIKERLGIDFGETSKDGEFTFLPVPCLGDCDRGPSMMVGENLHSNLTQDKIDEIIQQYRNQ